MNQHERDELRAKHHVGQNEADDQCQSCYSADGYPCDVIRVLDWAEAELMRYLEIQQLARAAIARRDNPELHSRNDSDEPCTHAHLSTIARLATMGVPCPLCGEKAEEVTPAETTLSDEQTQ